MQNSLHEQEQVSYARISVDEAVLGILKRQRQGHEIYIYNFFQLPVAYYIYSALAILNLKYEVTATEHLTVVLLLSKSVFVVC
jgi:hypothetical protein